MLGNIHPKYTLEVRPKEGTHFNPIHSEIDGLTATIVDLPIGERGSFVVDHGYGWMMISTSTVEDVSSDEQGNVTLTTRNTVYIFNKIT